MATASDITAGVTGTIRSLGSAVRGMGLAMTVGAGIAGAALIGLTQKAEKVSSAFREVDTLVQGASDAQAKYGDLVSDLNTKFGLQADKLEVIEGLYQSISAGVGQSTEAQREFLETAAELAVVSRVELGTSVDVLSTIMNTYGYEAGQAKDISESLFQTVQFGKTRMEELAPVLGRVAALGSNLGIQIDEIGASMAVLTRTGFGARVAATGLRNIFRAMLKPSDRMKEVLFEIAAEQDFFADQFEESSEKIKGIAKDFRDARDAVSEYAQKQADARALQESSSTAIEEARLKIQAIEEERLDQLPELTSKAVKEAETVEELEEVISNYQFKVNKARLEEEKFRKEKEQAQSQMEEYKNEIGEMIASNGDLEGGIGQLILENQNFIDTMVSLREKVNATETSMSDLFPRTRALQGALALAGEDGQMLTDIFKQMEEGSFDAAKAWDNMDESARANFDSFEDFKKATEDITAGDLQETFQKAQGPQQKLRNSMSKLREAIEKLGQVFTEDVVDSIVKFSDKVTGLIDKFENVDKKVRENISRFAVLATAVGLVLGPLLFFIGQMAVMGSVMGSSVIPVLAVLGVGIAALVDKFRSVVSGGRDAEAVFNNLRNTFSGVIDFVYTLKDAFVGELLPGLNYLTYTIVELFGEIRNQFGQNDEIAGFENIIYRVAFALRQVITTVADFLSNNKELIAELTVLAVDVILNQVLPAVTELAKGLVAVIQDIDWKLLASIAIPILVALGAIFIKLTRKLGVFLQENSKLIGQIVTWVIIIGAALAVIGQLVAIFAPVISAISTAVAIFGAWGVVIGAVSGGLTMIGGVLSTLVSFIPFATSIFTGLSAVFSALVTVGQVLAGVIVTIAGVLGLPVWAVVALIAVIGVLIGAMWIMRDEIVAAVTNIVDTFMDVFDILIEFLTTDMGWREAGEKIVDRLAQGMKDGVSILKDAAGTLAETISDFFPSSPAEEGPLAEEPPTDLGKNIAQYTAEGMVEGKGDVEDASSSLADSSIPNVDAAEFSPAGSGLGGSMGGENPQGKKQEDAGKEVTVEEGAVTVGPFHGISDEELPEEVREQVQKSLQDLMDEVKGSGKDSTTSLSGSATAI